MNKIMCLGSSSKGNCYILKGDKGDLIIEAGVSIKEIKQAINFDFSNVEGCLISHDHQDHSRSKKELYELGIKINPFLTDNFKISTFELFHDVPCQGFLIQEISTGETLLFATDTYMIKHKIDNLDYLMIECNYSEESLSKDIHKHRENRLYASHMSLEACIKYVDRVDKSNLKKIMLLHLSDENSDEKVFQKEIERLSQVETVVLDAGISVKLGGNPF